MQGMIALSKSGVEAIGTRNYVGTAFFLPSATRKFELVMN